MNFLPNELYSIECSSFPPHIAYADEVPEKVTPAVHCEALIGPDGPDQLHLGPASTPLGTGALFKLSPSKALLVASLVLGFSS